MLDLDIHLPGIAAGDQVAFAAWVVGAEHALRGSLRSFAAGVDVEAVLQETLLRAWQLAGRLHPDGRANALLRFAHRTARNLALDEARRRERAPRSTDEDGFEGLLARLADQGPAPPDPMLRRAIQACARLLPARPREALLARLEAGGGEPDQAIAARLGVKLNTLLQNVTRARQALAKCLEGRGISLGEVLR
jgi:RNA polymerase sigma factor (sigma-70 family)